MLTHIRRYLTSQLRDPLAAEGQFFVDAASINAIAASPPPAIFLWAVGIANLGYLLLAAGFYTGTFRIFGLRKRWQVISVAAICLLIGLGLSNPEYVRELFYGG